MTFKIKLNKAYQKQNGKYPLVLRITHNRKTFRVNLDYDCFEKDWDKDKEKFKTTYPDSKAGNIFLVQLKYKTVEVFNSIRLSKKPFSKDLFKRYLKGYDKETTFFVFTNDLIQEFEYQGKISNKDIYTNTKNRVFEFVNKKTSFLLSDIDFEFLKKFETFLFQNDNTSGGVHHHMRTLRSILNKAIDRGYLSEDLYPFSTNRKKRGYSLGHLKSSAKPRPLSIADMERFKLLEVKNEKKILAKNIFLFSYYVNGINFKDICLLEKRDFYNNRIIYNRSKTTVTFNVKVTDKIKTILDYFECEGKYLFPFLNENIHVSEQQIADKVKKTRKYINEGLREINNLLEININLTLYVARHTFASTAKKKGFSTDMISQALGHSSVKVTKAYLANFEDDEMDSITDSL